MPSTSVKRCQKCVCVCVCVAGTFREDNFQKAIGALTEAAAEAKGRPGAKSGKGGKRGSSDTGPNEKPDIYKIVRMCMERNYDPLIVFSFSKKECENLAKQVGRLCETSLHEMHSCVVLLPAVTCNICHVI